MRFILVDEILELVPNSHVKAVRYIPPDDDYFLDHFPGFPVVPGVLLTEMMGQAAGKCLIAGDPERGLPVLAKIKSASFRGWVKPGAKVTLLADIQACRPQFATAACRAEVEGDLVCSAELFFTFLAPANYPIGMRDEVLERFLRQSAASPAKPVSGSNRQSHG